ERDDRGAAEVALEQLPGLGSLGVSGFADENRRQLDPRPASADQLQVGPLPIDEPAASRASQHCRLCAELIRLARHPGHLAAAIAGSPPRPPPPQTTTATPPATATNVIPKSHNVV